MFIVSVTNISAKRCFSGFSKILFSYPFKLPSINDNNMTFKESIIPDDILNVSSIKPETSLHSKPFGDELYKKMNEPDKIVAPMVDQSELAWRILSRKYGANLCYTPMFHAKLFVTNEKYRKDMFCDLDGNPKYDRPLIVQFCANDPEYLLQAAELVQDQCDAVDLNLGCPQGIAKKGNYGSFLMDNWKLIYSLINTLHINLKVPVTAKIRLFPANSETASVPKNQPVPNGAVDEHFNKEKTLNYARMILKAGAQILTVHGRSRDMKGQKTGIANWNLIQFLHESLSKEYKEATGHDLVFFANGNILYPEDVERCLSQINCQGIMSAEGNLYNPGVFNTKDASKDKQYPRLDKISREYFDIVKSVQPASIASKIAMKAHFFKFLKPFITKHTHIRDMIAQTSVKFDDMDVWEKIVSEVEKVTKELDVNEENDVIKSGKLEWWGGSYKEIPYWRCQPYFRKVEGRSVVEDIKAKEVTELQTERNSKKRKLDCCRD